MGSDNLTAKEMVLIEILNGNVQSQRSIASASGFSLGMTNLLLKRLAKKGYIKVTTLNGRTLRYMLTPQGFAEKLKRSFHFILSSIRQLENLKLRVQDVIRERNLDGKRLVIVGSNELAGLSLEALRDVGVEAEILPASEIHSLFTGSRRAIIVQCDVNVDFHAMELPADRCELIELSGLLS